LIHVHKYAQICVAEEEFCNKRSDYCSSDGSAHSWLRCWNHFGK